MVAAGAAALVTLVAVLGGTGVLPSAPASAEQAHSQGSTSGSSDEAAALAGSGTRSSTGGGSGQARSGEAARQSQSSKSSSPPSSSSSSASSSKPKVDANRAPGIPADSGSGRRVVFDMSDQRVWLVTGREATLRTYLVSGSVTDNLDPGTYEVYSKSLRAWGVDDSGSMRYMVRFAHGSRAAIGFHDIPVLDGALVQTRDELGTPESHGCIRQWRPDARALWRFAPRGTTVVVTA
jgi:lipoprotein-anchoring transpeptidase ErfK/SrfK